MINFYAFIFDLDGTLTESKAPLMPEVADSLGALLSARQIGVMSGGAFSQFERQFLSRLPDKTALFKNLFLFKIL